MTWSFPTDILGEAFSVAPFIKGGGLWQKRRADLEAPSVGQAPRFTACVTQHLRPLRCESLISPDAADKDRNRVSEPESGPKACLMFCMGLVKCGMMRSVPVRALLRC